jgi:hypothetical protein
VAAWVKGLHWSMKLLLVLIVLAVVVMAATQALVPK